MSRKGKITIGVVTTVLAVLVGTALAALTNISLNQVNTPEPYNFGTVNITGVTPSLQIGKKPGTVLFQEFTMGPGDTIPWHYHKALAYVILESGTLMERHLEVNGSCSDPAQFTAPSGFVEQPGEVHTVTNSGTDTVKILWSTIYPEEDGPEQFGSFETGGIYPPSPTPVCP